MRTLYRWLGAACFLPAIAILAWGVLSFVGAVQQLNGGSFSVIVHAGTADLSIKADQLWVSLPPRVRLGRLEVRESDGSLLAAATKLSVGADAFTTKGPWTGDAETLWLRVERNPDGSLSFNKYIAPPKGEPQEVPFNFYVAKSTIIFTDFSGGPRFRRVIRGQDTLASGTGSKLWVRSSAEIEGTGSLGLDLYTNDDGMILEASGGLRPTEWLAHFRRTPEGKGIKEIRTLKVGGGWLNGDYRLRIPKEGAPKFTFEGKGEVTGFAYNEFDADFVAFRGIARDSDYRGTVSLRAGATTLAGEGKAIWQSGNYGVANFTASAPSRQSLPSWVIGYVPKDVSFVNGSAKGWVSWKDANVSLGADADASRLTTAGETILQPRAKIAMSDGAGAAEVLSGRWMDAPVQGIFSWTDKQRIAGGLRSGEVDLARLGQRFKFQDFGGKATVNAVLAGTFQKPEVKFSSVGQAISRVPGYPLSLGRFVGAGTFKDGLVTVNRLQVGGPSGRLLAKGTFNPQSQAYNFEMEGFGIPISAFSKDADGQISFVGNVKGKGEKYEGEGRLEVFDASSGEQKLAYLGSKWRLTPRLFESMEFVALQKGIRGEGAASIDLKTQALKGFANVTGISAADYIGEGVEGIIDIYNGQFTGTTNKPKFDGDVVAKNVVAGPLRLTELNAALHFANSLVTVDALLAKTTTGSITGDLHLKPDSQVGDFNLAWKDLEIGSLLPALAENTTVNGLLTGQANGAFKGSLIEAVNGKTEVQNFALNNQVVGSGDVNFAAKGTEWTGSAEIGQIDQYLALKEILYDTKDKSISAQIIAGDVDLTQIGAVTKRYIDDYLVKNGQNDAVEKLRASKGRLSLQATLDGVVDDPILDVQSLDLADWTFGDVKGGHVNAKGSRSGGLWTVDSFLWDGPGRLNFAGTIDEEGETHLTGSLTELTASWLGWFDSRFASSTGLISAPLFSIDGATKSPEVQASLSYNETDKVAIDLIAEVAKGLAKIDGTYFFKGLTGVIEGNTAFDFENGLAEDAPISLKAKSDPRDLNSLAQYFPWLDATRSKGNLDAVLDVSGTLKDPVAFAEVTGLGSTIAFSDLTNAPFESLRLGTMMNDPSLRINLNGKSATLSASAKSSDGGDLAIRDAGILLSDLEQIMAGNTEALYNSPVVGELLLNNFQMVVVDKYSGKMETILTTEGLQLSGSLREPLLSGNIYVDKSNLIIPSMKEGTPSTSQSDINARFDVDVTTRGPVDFKAGAGGFRISGDAHIGGSLNDLNVDAPLIAESGSIRLPNARISVDQGGRIRLRYQGGAMTSELNLLGHTQLTAQGITGNVERYDITLEITGDIMKESGIQLKASADPPDLPQDRILAMLGQRELIAGVATETNVSKQIQSALMGVAIPYLGSNLTDKLAASIGLDYLNIDYNAFEQISISGGFALSKDFSVSGRRQISAPLPGQRAKWDLRVSYRPSFGPKALRRFSFSFGMDQDRPWKISVEYGIRF